MDKQLFLEDEWKKMDSKHQHETRMMEIQHGKKLNELSKVHKGEAEELATRENEAATKFLNLLQRRIIQVEFNLSHLFGRHFQEAFSKAGYEIDANLKDIWDMVEGEIQKKYAEEKRILDNFKRLAQSHQHELEGNTQAYVRFAEGVMESKTSAARKTMYVEFSPGEIGLRYKSTIEEILERAERYDLFPCSYEAALQITLYGKLSKEFTVFATEPFSCNYMSVILMARRHSCDKRLLDFLPTGRGSDDFEIDVDEQLVFSYRPSDK